MFDTIVSPVALYASELWAPLNIPQKCFTSTDSLLSAWESFKPELLNQKVCRLLLGVNRKATRLAVLGEMGRFPLLIKAISHAIKYEWHITNQSDRDSLIYQATEEMKCMPEVKNGWYHRIRQIKTLFKVPNFPGRLNPKLIGKKVKKIQ